MVHVVLCCVVLYYSAIIIAKTSVNIRLVIVQGAG